MQRLQRAPCTCPTSRYSMWKCLTAMATRRAPQFAQLPGGVNVPIVMVTGLDDPRSIDSAYDVGATDFVVKPINWALIVHRIRYVLRGARTLEALRFSEQKNAALLKAIPDGIFLVDAEGVISHRVSPIAGLADGAQSQDGRARSNSSICSRSGCTHGPWSACSATLLGAPAAFEFPLEVQGHATRHFECRYAPNATGQVLAIIRDITARKQTEAHIHRLAYFDVLTDLPNREWLGEYLPHSLGAGPSGRSQPCRPVRGPRSVQAHQRYVGS